MLYFWIIGKAPLSPSAKKNFERSEYLSLTIPISEG